MTYANSNTMMPMKASHILIIAVLILGIALGILLGKPFNPSSSEKLTALFSYPDDSACPSPCMLGIQAGLTAPNEAVELLKKHPLTKGNTIRQGQDSLNVRLEKNTLEVKVDYKANQVLEVDLISEGINGLGFIGISIDGKAIKWSDILSYFGSPEVITASAGDGGMVSLAAGLYQEGWCIHAEPGNSYDHPPTLLTDSRIIRIEINCHLLKDLDQLK